MNIFYLDKDISKCVNYHNDRHVVKMIVEYCQLASNAHWYYGHEGPYRYTHKKHPCTSWVISSKQNYNYLVDLGLALCKEYTYRYEKTHATQKKLEWLKDNIPDELPDNGFSEPPKVIPEHCEKKDTVESYRGYYRLEKQHIANWKKRNKPHWY